VLSGESRDTAGLRSHGYTLTSSRLLLYKQLDRLSLPRADRVVTVSQAFARDLQQRGVPQEKLTVLHNAVDPSGSGPRRCVRARARTARGREGRAIVGTPSMESRTSSWSRRLRGAGMLPAPPPLTETGGTPRNRTGSSLRAARSVIAAGHRTDVAPYAAQTSPSGIETEGSPVLIEAMSGRHQIATSVGGIPELVTHVQSALLVPPSDVDALAAALAQALAEPAASEAMARRAHARVLANYAPERRAQSLCDMYAALVATGRKVAA
jgi:glycosyltransferase involved in cell wall biosynthesis